MRDPCGQDLEEGMAVVFACYHSSPRMDGVGYPMKLGKIEKI